IRGAPRDALVAHITPTNLRGAIFGLRQSLATVGAFLGPVAAIGLMWVTRHYIVSVFWSADIPAFLSFLLITMTVKRPERPAARRPIKMLRSGRELKRLGAPYWWIVATGTVFTLARFSEAFLVLRAHSVGLSLALVPAVLVIMNISYALSAYPIGALSDRMDRMTILITGLVMLLVADVILALATGIMAVANGAALWGVDQGIFPRILSALGGATRPARPPP